MEGLTCDRSDVISAGSDGSDRGQENKNKFPQSRVTWLPDVRIAWVLSHVEELNRQLNFKPAEICFSQRAYV